MRIQSSPDSRRFARRYAQPILVLGFLGTVTLLWFVGYQRPSYHPVPVLPLESRFWSFFVNLLAFGFGIDRVSNILGALYLCIVVIPIIAGVLINKRNLSIGQWRILALTLAILGVLASVSAGRAGFGIQQTKESRYFEFAMPLIPLSVLNWAFLFPKKQYLKVAIIASLLIVCFAGFRNNWKEFSYYKREAIQRSVGVKCLTAYYKGKADNNCSSLFPVPIPRRLLEQARALNVSFYRRISKQSAGD
jgi:hypothetical protein